MMGESAKTQPADLPRGIPPPILPPGMRFRRAPPPCPPIDREGGQPTHTYGERLVRWATSKEDAGGVPHPCWQVGAFTAARAGHFAKCSRKCAASAETTRSWCIMRRRETMWRSRRRLLRLRRLAACLSSSACRDGRRSHKLLASLRRQRRPRPSSWQAPPLRRPARCVCRRPVAAPGAGGV